jgi:hypothetical protein
LQKCFQSVNIFGRLDWKGGTESVQRELSMPAGLKVMTSSTGLWKCMKEVRPSETKEMVVRENEATRKALEEVVEKDVQPLM